MISILPTTLDHVDYIYNTLRVEDKKEIESAGVDPKVALYGTQKQALFSKTALVDEKPAAIWGLAGVLLSDTGVPFLLTGSEVWKIHPLKFSRLYIKEVEEMKTYFPRLENYVDCSYTGAVGMLKIAGFSFGEPFPFKDGMYQKFYMENYDV